MGDTKGYVYDKKRNHMHSTERENRKEERERRGVI